MRTGAPKPDISSVEALRRALLAAKSITYAKEGGSGIYFAGLLELVAAGQAEMAVQLITELIAVRGVDFVGPLPGEVQNYIVLTAGVGTQAREPGLARDFLLFLTAPGAVPVIRSKGLEPGSGR